MILREHIYWANPDKLKKKKKNKEAQGHGSDFVVFI